MPNFVTENIDNKIYLVDFSSDFDQPLICKMAFPTDGDPEIIKSGLRATRIDNHYSVRVDNDWLNLNVTGKPVISYVPYLRPAQAKYYKNGDWHS